MSNMTCILRYVIKTADLRSNFSNTVKLKANNYSSYSTTCKSFGDRPPLFPGYSASSYHGENTKCSRTLRGKIQTESDTIHSGFHCNLLCGLVQNNQNDRKSVLDYC